MTEHAVIIAGGGPTGMMLAAELAIAGVDVAIVERRASAELVGSRAGGLHSRSIEVFDQRGVADRFVSQGQKYPTGTHFQIPLDISDCPTRFNYTLGLWQNHIERIMAQWLGELSVRIYREREVTGFAQDALGVSVSLSDGESLGAQYLIGCEGGRSVIRKAADIDFPGWDATTSWLIAEVTPGVEPEWGFRQDAVGFHGIGKLDGGPRARIVLTEARLAESASEPTLRDVRDALTSVYGTDFGIHSPTWISRFDDMTRQAASYRNRRVLLAGDSAHVHPPLGGQGLNLGVQDAVNLGWKLAQVVKGISPDTLLDTYHAERHPVAARVLRTVMAQVALRRPDDRTRALCETLGEILRMDEPRKRLSAELAGLHICYDMSDASDHSGSGPTRASHADHPLLGRRMPDLDIEATNGPRRVFSLLHHARPVLLNLCEPGHFDITPWLDRVDLVDARYAGPWELPVLGAVPAPNAVLIRPDGYVAWVGDTSHNGLSKALARWFGPE